MASRSKDILVFGATGVIGQYIIRALIAEKANFGRLAIFTSPSTVESKAGEIGFLKSNGVEVLVGDVRDEQQVRDGYNKGFDTVISAVGRNVIAEQINLIRIAESCPVVKRFFPSEYGTDIEYWPHSVHEKPHQQKLKVRAYIKENVKRLEYTYLVTGPYSDLYLGKMEAEKVGSFDVRAKRAVLLGSGNDRISFTTMLDVGKLLVAALKHPDISRNRALLVNSFTTTPNEILAEFEKQTDSKWSVKYNPLDDLKHQEQDAWARQDPLATLYTLRRIWTEGGTLYEKRDNEILEATDMETLEDAVRCAIETEAAGYRSGKM